MSHAPVSRPRRELDAARLELTTMADRVRRRGAWTCWSDVALDLLFYAWFAFACLVLVDRIRAGVGQVAPVLSAGGVVLTLLGITAACLAWAALTAWWRTPRDLELAWRTDQRFGLEERFSSALALLGMLQRGELAGRPAELARAQVEDAARFVRVQNPRQVFPGKPLGHRWTSAAALVIALYIALLPDDEFRAAGGRPTTGAGTPRIERSAGTPRRTPERRTATAGKTGERTQPVPVPGQPEPKPKPEQQPQDGGGQGEPPPDPSAPEPPKDAPEGGGDGGQGRPEGPQESPEEMFGEPERAAAKSRPKEVDPLLGEGPTRKEDIQVHLGNPGGGGAGSAVPLDFPSLFREYQRVAEQALQPERVPPADRDYVKRYFESIRPKD